MKQIIKVNIKKVKADFADRKTDLLAVGMFEGDKGTEKAYSKLDKQLDGGISRLIKLGDFKGKLKSTSLVYGTKKTAADRILLVGLGDRKKFEADNLRQAAAVASSKAVDLKAEKSVFAVHQSLDKELDIQQAGQIIAEGVYFGSYRYDEFVTEDKDGRSKKLNVEVAETKASDLNKLGKGITAGKAIGESQSYARTIANRPGNIINPPELAKEARKLARQIPGLSCTVFDKKKMKQKKMGGVLAVGQGSQSDPRFIVLRYNPRAGKGKVPTICLVGKAITFDSGGISIKPSSGMQDMKLDKSGGISVLGAMRAIAKLKPKVKVYGIIPSAENMPSGTSYRPGDIVTTYSGKTVEIHNTDAEGRMILSDGIHYATEQKPDAIVDIATLTGACMIALGKHKAGLMGSDDELIEQLKQASESSGEKVWHLPSGEEYLEQMKSKVADLKNIGGRWGGASTAGAFLGSFAGGCKWAHIDMAGVDMFEGSKAGQTPGSSGFGVRLLSNFVLNSEGKTAKKK
jgi:leucyl aminopeptidase